MRLVEEAFKILSEATKPSISPVMALAKAAKKEFGNGVARPNQIPKTGWACVEIFGDKKVAFTEFDGWDTWFTRNGFKETDKSKDGNGKTEPVIELIKYAHSSNTGTASVQSYFDHVTGKTTVSAIIRAKP